MTAPLVVDGIEHGYGNVGVLFGVSLSIAPGEALALVGTNGAGKSTLLRVVAGLERPRAGRVVLDDVDITGQPAAALVRRGLVLVQGGRAVFPDMTVADNLAILAGTVRRRRAWCVERRELALATFPVLRQRWRHTAGTLSGGEQQQLALAKALLLEPRVLCIDELSLGLAPIVVAALMDTLRVLHDDGVTLLLVEQSLTIAASVCERAVFLEKGEVRFEGKTSDLLERDDIARAVFLGAR